VPYFCFLLFGCGFALAGDSDTIEARRGKPKPDIAIERFLRAAAMVESEAREEESKVSSGGPKIQKLSGGDRVAVAIPSVRLSFGVGKARRGARARSVRVRIVRGRPVDRSRPVEMAISARWVHQHSPSSARPLPVLYREEQVAAFPRWGIWVWTSPLAIRTRQHLLSTSSINILIFVGCGGGQCFRRADVGCPVPRRREREATLIQRYS
jgi:hypothetical protein